MARTHSPITKLLNSWFKGMGTHDHGVAADNDVQKLYDLALDENELDIARAIDAYDNAEIIAALLEWGNRVGVSQKIVSCIQRTSWTNNGRLNLIHY